MNAPSMGDPKSRPNEGGPSFHDDWLPTVGHDGGQIRPGGGKSAPRPGYVSSLVLALRAPSLPCPNPCHQRAEACQEAKLHCGSIGPAGRAQRYPPWIAVHSTIMFL